MGVALRQETPAGLCSWRESRIRDWILSLCSWWDSWIRDWILPTLWGLVGFRDSWLELDGFELSYLQWMSIVYRRDRLSTYVYDPVTDTFSHKTDPSRPVSPIYEKPKVLKEHKRERRKNQRYLFLNIFRGRKGWVFEVNDVLCRFDYNYESVCDADLQLNQIIVSVAPELVSRKRFWVSLRMAWRARMFSQIDWKRDSHTWLKITIS